MEILKTFEGPWKAYIKAYAGSDNDPITGNTVDWTGWTQIAGDYTADGTLVISYEAETEDVKIEGYNTAIERPIIGENAKIVFAVKQGTVATLEYALMGATYESATSDGSDTNDLNTGDYGFPRVFSIGLEGSNAAGLAVVAFIQRCTANPSFEITIKKGDNDGIPYEFNALADTTTDIAAGKRLLRIREITSA